MRKPFAFVTKNGRVVREDILEQYANKSASKQLPADMFTDSYNQHGLVQPLYNPEALARILELNTYHYRACKTKARDVAGLGWQIIPLVDKPNESMQTMLEDFFSDLSEPVSKTFDKVMFDYEAIGYGAAELTRVDYKHDGEPADLVHIPAHTLRVHRDGNRFVQVRGSKTRWFKRIGFEHDVDFETGHIKELGSLAPERRATEIFWVVNYTPRSDYYGLPDVIPALGAIHGDAARRDYNIAFFDNWGVPAYAVFITGNFDPGELDEDGKSEFEKSIEEHFNELSKSPHSTLIMSIPTIDGRGEVEIEFKPLSVDVKEASFRLYRKDNRDEVLAAHGVPPYRMGIAETGSLGGNTAQESTEIYKRSVVEPRQEMLEGLINKHILYDGFEAFDFEFKFAEIDTSDEKHDMEIAIKLFDKAAMTPNQLILHFGERFGLDRVEHPAMDAHYLNGKPITLEVDVAPELEATLMSLQERLLEVAEKYADSDKDGTGDREIIDVIKSFKAVASKAITS
ncbi:MAG: phage portal protein [bacterium]|nr:phage portal protein [bacterium]